MAKRPQRAWTSDLPGPAGPAGPTWAPGLACFGSQRLALLGGANGHGVSGKCSVGGLWELGLAQLSLAGSSVGATLLRLAG